MYKFVIRKPNDMNESEFKISNNYTIIFGVFLGIRWTLFERSIIYYLHLMALLFMFWIHFTSSVVSPYCSTSNIDYSQSLCIL